MPGTASRRKAGHARSASRTLSWSSRSRKLQPRVARRRLSVSSCVSEAATAAPMAPSSKL
eukprot:1412619-Prymnesium_polylepis.1